MQVDVNLFHVVVEDNNVDKVMLKLEEVKKHKDSNPLKADKLPLPELAWLSSPYQLEKSLSGYKGLCISNLVWPWMMA